MSLPFEGNDTGFTRVLARSPTESPQEEENKGDERKQITVSRIQFSLLSTPTFGEANLLHPM